MVKVSDYKGVVEPTWCPGCGNFGILAAVKRALADLEIEPYTVLLVSGIGQAGKLPHYTRCNLLNVLHGRTLPAATAAKIANPKMVVIAVGGDGDGYAEGGNHFVHSVRRNHDITYLVHNNQVYGLTKGQASPTSDQGFVTKTSPHGAPSPVNPIALAIAAGGAFVARAFAGDSRHLAELIKSAIRFPGFALIDVLQPCVTFNKVNTYEWYRGRVYKVDESSYDVSDRGAAFLKAQEWGSRIPIGVIYREERPTFEQQLPVLAGGPLVEQRLDPGCIEPLLQEFM
jgi:2-oxoglutarate ferredoxin oxidoreductase subunit beta